jgi:hypothetical protein
MARLTKGQRGPPFAAGKPAIGIPISNRESLYGVTSFSSTSFGFPDIGEKAFTVSARTY